MIKYVYHCTSKNWQLCEVLSSLKSFTAEPISLDKGLKILFNFFFKAINLDHENTYNALGKSYMNITWNEVVNAILQHLNTHPTSGHSLSSPSTNPANTVGYVMYQQIAVCPVNLF